MSDQLTEEQLAEYRDAFSIFDKNNDGDITTSDLGIVMRSLGYNLTELQLQKIIDEYDADKSGSMNFREFLQMMLHRDMNDVAANNRFNDLLQTFGMFDKDGDGYISPGELRDAMYGLGEYVSDFEVTEMIRDADANGDNQIDYKEFETLMHSPP